jgi:hypothetical protein
VHKIDVLKQHEERLIHDPSKLARYRYVGDLAVDLLRGVTGYHPEGRGRKVRIRQQLGISPLPLTGEGSAHLLLRHAIHRYHGPILRQLRPQSGVLVSQRNHIVHVITPFFRV